MVVETVFHLPGVARYLVGAALNRDHPMVMGVVLKQPIYLGLIYAFVWEGFIGSLPGAIGNITILNQLRVIASSEIHNGSISGFSGDAGVSLVSLLVLTVVLLLIGAYTFRVKQVP